ncbi:uncharacterized protein LOC144017570 [Festucalex cinctus]
MASTSVLLLQLLLVSVVSASHHFGGLSNFNGELNSDGTYTVNINFKATFRECYFIQFMHCYNGNCGHQVNSHRALLDNSTNSPRYTNQWCEAETVMTRRVPSNKPFSMRSSSCCWIPTRHNLHSWRLLTTVDLGTRSDTGGPNKSPVTGVLPFLRVPQNCPRTYKPMAFDADGDRVRCRYGQILNQECGACHHHVGFYLDQDSCTLHYRYTPSDHRVFGFETVVEDFPQQPITLSYSDGSHSFRSPLMARRKRRSPHNWWHTASSSTAPPPWRRWRATTTHPWWWLWTQQPAGQTTTPQPNTTPRPWWWWLHNTGATTTTSGQTTTQHFRPATRKPRPVTRPWWWWLHNTGATITTSGQTTTQHVRPATRKPRPVTRPWWWWLHSTGPVATTAPWQWHSTTQHLRPATRKPRPVTRPWWWWVRSTGPVATATIRPWHPTAQPLTTTSGYPYDSTSPLSKLPMQFSFLVDPPAPSCQEGRYIPKLLYPTPQNGQRIYAEVNKEVEIRVKAQAMYATIHDIIMSGPIDSNKHRTTHDEFVIRWIPRREDEGRHFPLCFAVESVTSRFMYGTTPSHRYNRFPGSNQSVYQSEMICVLIEVHKETVNATVTCDQSNMTVVVEKASLHWISLDHLRLSDPGNVECNLQTHSNSTHVVAVVPLYSCGTQLEEDDDNLIFKNEITTVDNPRDIITRKHRLEVGFHCQYAKRGNVTQSFIGHRKNITVWEKGFGTFTYQFEFYPNNEFEIMYSPTLYPLVYTLGRRIYMKIEASSSINSTELFVESCSAAPYDNPNYRPTYAIIANGCPVDPTVEIHSPAHEHEFRFSIEAFQFIGLHDHVYISCSVMMCEAGNPHTRCSRGCINSTFPNGNQHRGKREAVIQSANHFVSQGPLRLQRSAETNERTAMNLNMNIIFIAGCLLAAVGMISGVVMYKAKMSHVKYQRLPTCES